MEDSVKSTVIKANRGDKKALEEILVGIREKIYNLALRMLLFPEDAEDATQEILIKVVTHLSTFKHESQFSTWVYRISANYLIQFKSKIKSPFPMPFEEYGKFIDTGISDLVTYARNEGELRLLEEEVKVSCTHGMLLCLDKQHRIAYILGEILSLNSLEAAQVLEINPATFRKQLSRARTKIRTFLGQRCGLMKESNRCRCKKKIDYLSSLGMVDIDDLKFAKSSSRSIDLLKNIDDLEKSVHIFQSTSQYDVPETLIVKMKKTLELL